MTLYYLKVASYIYIFQNISLHTQYFNIDDAKTFVNKNISSGSFSVLHINIRSMQKNFEKFKNSLKLWSLILVQHVFQKLGVIQ